MYKIVRLVSVMSQINDLSNREQNLFAHQLFCDEKRFVKTCFSQKKQKAQQKLKMFNFGISRITFFHLITEETADNRLIVSNMLSVFTNE